MQVQSSWFCQCRILVLVHPGQTSAHPTLTTAGFEDFFTLGIVQLCKKSKEFLKIKQKL